MSKLKNDFDRMTERLRPVNDKYGLPLAIVALVVAVVALAV